MPKMPAARMTDTCQHGGVIMPPCALKTKVEMLPAARITDIHVCPMVTGVVPHVGGPVITGAFTILIEFLPATRVNEKLICVGPPDMIAKGASNTFYGDGGGGGAMMTMAAPAASGLMPLPSGSAGSATDGGQGATSAKCTSVGHPVDVATGSVFTLAEEFVTPDALHFAFLRYYCTANANKPGSLGWGWSHPLEERIELEGEFLTYVTWEGRRITFPALAVENETMFHLDEKYLLRRLSNGYALSDSRLSREFTSQTDTILRLTALADKQERAARIEWNGNLPTRFTDAAGNQWHFRSEDGRQLSSIHFQAQDSAETSLVAAYEYDSRGNLASAADPLRHTTLYDYDGQHRLAREVNRANFSYFFQYDALGRCVRTWGETGEFDTTLLYSETEPQTTARDAAGHATVYCYNDLGLVTETIFPDGRSETCDYQWGNLIRRAVGEDQAWHWVCDAEGRVAQTISPGGHVRKMGFGAGAAGSVTDANGQTLEYAQEDNQLVARHAALEAPLLTIAPDPARRALAMRDALGHEAQFIYDGADRLQTYIDPCGRAYQYEYDARGHLSKYTGAAGAGARFERDARQNLTAVVRSDGRAERYAYDAAARLTHRTDGNGNTFRFDYSNSGVCQRVTAPNGQITQFDYDALQRLRQITDERDAKIQFSYDARGRKEMIRYPDGATETFRYDAAGKIAEQVTRASAPIAYTRDLDGNPTQIAYADGTAQEFTFDPEGQVLRAASAASETCYTYDALGFLTREEADGEPISYEYDPGGRLTEMALPDGSAVKYAYYADSQISEITDWNGGVHRFAFDAETSEGTHEFPNGLTSRARYNQAGLALQITLQAKASPRPLAQIGYRYDGNDNVVETQDAQFGATRYAYDALSRLTEAAHRNSAWREAFAYDSAGNALRFGSETHPRHYDLTNRLLNGPETRCRYDASGNVIELTRTGQPSLRFVYNAQNLLTKALLPDGSETLYTYDAFHRRILKRQAENTTRYYWAGDQMVCEVLLDAEDTVIEQRDYLYVPDSFLPLAMRINGVPYYFHCDHRGAPVRVSNAEGQIVWAAEYTAFGEARISVSQVEHSLRFPGQYFDAETGLHYNSARYYHPALGRYLSPDPLGMAGGLNFYAYANNDPINLIDPLGLVPYTLPPNPSGLPPGWKPIPHNDPNGGTRWEGPGGTEGLEYHPGKPGEPGFEGEDHWHKLKPKPGKPGKWEKDDTGGRKGGHYRPGDKVELEPCDANPEPAKEKPVEKPKEEPKEEEQPGLSPTAKRTIGVGILGILGVGALILLAPETGGASLIPLLAL